MCVLLGMLSKMGCLSGFFFSFWEMWKLGLMEFSQVLRLNRLELCPPPRFPFTTLKDYFGVLLELVDHATLLKMSGDI